MLRHEDPHVDATPDQLAGIEHILHPTDFSEGSRVAFLHALKAALLAKAKLTLLHVAGSHEFEWSDFPGVREALERWGVIPAGSPRSAVPRLGIEVRKVVARERDPVREVLTYLARHPADLIVLATHQREGRARWLEPSVAEPIARRAAEMTLFIPGEQTGFVSAESGQPALSQILIPVAKSPRGQPAVDAAARLVASLGARQGVFTLLHVGAQGAMPALHCPQVPGWEWRRVTRDGEVIQAIIDNATQTRADLIVMVTDGRDGFLDALRGGHSERVLRLAPAPLLTLPDPSLEPDLPLHEDTDED